MISLNMRRARARLRQWLRALGAQHLGIAAGVLVTVAVVTHLALVFWLPRHANGEVWQFLSGNGQLVNAWYHAERQTPENAGDIKAAPEVGYSTCAIDLSDGPVRLRVNAWSPYTSLALYDATGFNFFSVNDTQMPDGYAELMLGMHRPADDGSHYLRSPTRRVVAMIRRLIPDDDGWSEIVSVRADDVCARVSNEGTGS